MVDYLMPNETEAQLLGEVAYTGTAIVTQGERGSLLMRPGRPDVRIDALHVLCRERLRERVQGVDPELYREALRRFHVAAVGGL